MKIGQLAVAASVSVQTIRYYERRGLLPPPSRYTSGYREYEAESVKAVLSIKQLQAAGFTLREVQAFLSLLTQQPHDPADTRALVEAKLNQMGEQISRLETLRQELRERLATCKCCNPPGTALARNGQRRRDTRAEGERSDA